MALHQGLDACMYTKLWCGCYSMLVCMYRVYQQCVEQLVVFHWIIWILPDPAWTRMSYTSVRIAIYTFVLVKYILAMYLKLSSYKLTSACKNAYSFFLCPCFVVVTTSLCILVWTENSVTIYWRIWGKFVAILYRMYFTKHTSSPPLWSVHIYTQYNAQWLLYVKYVILKVICNEFIHSSSI